MAKKSKRWRAIKFGFLRHVLLPTATWIVRLYMKTWRIEYQIPEAIADLGDANSKTTVACLHESVIILMGGMMKFPVPIITIAMVSPSKDGLLIADTIRRFGGEPVMGSSSARGVAALKEQIRVVGGNRVGAVTIDGPRGPRGVGKMGVFHLSQACKSRLYALAITAKPLIRVRKAWDQTMIPLPFSKVTLRFELFHDYATGEFVGNEEHAMRRKLMGMLDEIGGDSSVIPPPPKDDEC